MIRPPWEQVQVSKENSVPVKVRIIEWKQGKHRQIYFGEMPGRATYVEDGRTIKSQFPYSAYISWPGLEAQADLLALGGMAPDPTAQFIITAQGAIEKHFRERRRQKRREQINAWKSQGIYPYRGEPASETEKVERSLFDVVSGTISGQVAKDQIEASLTLRLLKNVLNSQPGELIVI